MTSFYRTLQIACMMMILAVPGSVFAADSSLQISMEHNLGSIRGGVFVTDIRTGEVLASIHPEIFLDQEHPPGSLIKVFTLLSYYQQHGNQFPVLDCPRTLASDPLGCWDRNGHGKVDITRALAFSCNVYFRQLSANISTSTFSNILKRFDLIPSTNITDESVLRKLMVGYTNEWKIAPFRIVRAYAALYNGGFLYPAGTSTTSSQIMAPPTALELIRNGMSLSAEEGTSFQARLKAGVPVLGKTGTSLMEESTRSNWRKTQGWWIGLFPSIHPEIVVLTFVPEGRGATDAAPLGGKVVRIYRNHKAMQ